MHILFNCETTPEAIESNLQGLSWSFSHFFLWRGFRLQFDCGEAAGMRLDSHVFRTDTVALSHSHFDHCRGLAGLLNVRSGLMGATEKPLKIIYPDDSSDMGMWIDEAQRMARSRRLDHVSFQPIRAGDAVAFRRDRVIEAAEVRHVEGRRCLAYRVGRMRKRLRPEFLDCPPSKLAELAHQGRRDEFEAPCFEVELVYSGDTERLAPDFCRDAQVLIHESTFLHEADAEPEKGLHATVESALRCAAEARVRHLILFHVSRRYLPRVLIRRVKELISQVGLECPVVLLRGSFNLPTD